MEINGATKYFPEYIGHLTNGWILYCRIGHDNAGIGGAWYLDRVEIEVPSLGKKWLATCEKWLSKKKGDGLIEREIYLHRLVTYKKETAQHNKDEQDIEQRAEIKPEIIVSTKSAKSSEVMGESQVEYDSDIPEHDVRVKDEVQVEFMQPVESARPPDMVDDSPVEIETRSFPIDTGYQIGEINKTAEEMSTQIIGQITENKVDTLKQTYRVFVYTGNKWGAGTDAGVYLKMFGELHETDEIQLKDSLTNKKMFERKVCDEFEIEATDIGEPQKIR